MSNLTSHPFSVTRHLMSHRYGFTLRLFSHPFGITRRLFSYAFGITRRLGSRLFGAPLRLFSHALIPCLLVSCVSQLPTKSVESLDETTGMTLANLIQPMAFVETGIDDLLVPDKQPSVVYLGPEEWDRSGDFSYVLWAQVAPGVDGHRIDDIRARGALVLKLDDGTVSLSALEQPVTNSPYAPIPPVGQAAYFRIDVALLKRMASSRKIVLNVRAGDLSRVDFIAREDARVALRQFMIDRSILDE